MNNPTFTIVAPRLFSAYSEAVNPINLWVDGRQDDGQLKLDVARSFFEAARFPDDFHRAARPMSADNEAVVLTAHPVEPGRNVNGVNTYTVDASTGTLPDKCSTYEGHVNYTLRALYPNPTGDLLDAIRANVHYFYTSVQAAGCAEIFPFGKAEEVGKSSFSSNDDLPGNPLNVPDHSFASATEAGPRTVIATPVAVPTATQTVPAAPVATVASESSVASVATVASVTSMAPAVTQPAPVSSLVF